MREYLKNQMDESLFTCEVKFYLTEDFPDLASQPVLFVLQPEDTSGEYEQEVRLGLYVETHDCVLEMKEGATIRHDPFDIRFMAKVPEVPKKYKSGVGP